MSKTILLVEDSTSTRDLYQEILQEAGFTVASAIDGKEAISEVKKGIYDAVLLDIMMPVANGVSFLKNLKMVDLINKPVVILLTNLAHEQVIQEALHLGAHSYLLKSEITPSYLVAYLEKVLQSS